MAIEVTDEMREAFEAAAWPPNWVGGEPLWEDGLAAVLAIVERDLAGPCTSEMPRILGDGVIHCELRQGHDGRHVSGPTTWWECL